ncbi:nitrate reductase molybdenum cofactor assembly chaperone [Gephyromycinifex aptenodytis]|uniref:nitrate reductase molybdenum cofactor assembly chaperone n=1 Tax=Gephyromycinifex aptenodytis TaxID=2716227 RepID=UPI0014484E11|nr:nitrate reductase molybdenum cofactor assembly chaperone [Gephyromycinifex aptenodytis]
MRIPIQLFRRKPAPQVASQQRGEDELGLGVPWTPQEGAPRVPRRSTDVLERARGVKVSAAHQSIYKAAGLLLEYPSEELIESLPLVRAALEESCAREAGPVRELSAVIEHLESVPLEQAQSEYVETFDMRRRCCLHLTYYAFGDTRRRGMALLDIKQTYQACGAQLDESELPDHLCVLLDFAACVDGPVGRTLLLDHRPGLELLRISLQDRGSVYAHVIAAVSATLPNLDGSDKDAVRRLIATGPPDEEVGMEAYVSSSHVATGVRS